MALHCFSGGKINSGKVILCLRRHCPEGREGQESTHHSPDPKVLQPPHQKKCKAYTRKRSPAKVKICLQLGLRKFYLKEKEGGFFYVEYQWSV